MGFLASASTITITAKLTPFGRQQLLTNNSSIITKFGLGDSDANYMVDTPLSRGEVPSLAGQLGTSNMFSNGVFSGVNIKSPILVNSLGDIRKNVEGGSSQVVITPKPFGLTGATGSTLSQFIIDKDDTTSDSLVNLFKTFGLPITQSEKDLYTSFTSPVGYLDTAIRNLNKKKVLVIAIDSCSYGEILDGKAIKVELETTGSTQHTLYTTFQSSLTSPSTVDTQVKENLGLGTVIGNNIAFLFSDNVGRPNGNPTKSWGTGFGIIKPFSLNNKERFNAVSVPSTNKNVDKAVGVVYLDRGFIVITEPSIVDNYDINSASGTTTVTYNHISNEVAQNITCIVERDEFESTNNSTYTSGDLIRVSEVALYDTMNNVIAYAKSNEHITMGASQYLALGIRILV